MKMREDKMKNALKPKTQNKNATIKNRAENQHKRLPETLQSRRMFVECGPETPPPSFVVARVVSESLHPRSPHTLNLAEQIGLKSP